MAADITYWVYQCNSGRGTGVVGLGPNVYPTCNGVNNGGWIQVQQVNNLPFDPATLDAETLGTAYGAGFFVMAMSMTVCMGIISISRFIRNHT